MCFVAMPFGKKPPPGKKKPLIDFDRIYRYIERAVLETGLECVRADFEAYGGFIHRQMYERLLVAEYLVADLTSANPNVTYEVGIRHGSRAKATLLVCASDFIDNLPFDLKPLRVLNYSLGPKGKLSDEGGEKLQLELSKRLKEAVAGELPPDNPILQVTAVESSGRIQHEKTDVFIKRIRYVSELGERIYAALNKEFTAAINELQAIESEVLDTPQVVMQLHTKLISLYLGYRELKAYRQMQELFDKLPEELQRTPVAIEQLALALNRLAEEGAADGDKENSTALRKEAIQRLNELEKTKWTSETYGILGRIYKGQAEIEQQSDKDVTAAAAMNRAIETYEAGFRLDPRDYYPGVNAVTLRLLRGTPEDLDMLRTLVPVVRFSVERAPSPEDEMERYWQEATKLELDCAGKDWKTAQAQLLEVVGIDVKSWMRETTIKNLKIQQQAFESDAQATGSLDQIIKKLQPR
jgi:tetratricopeptide (TPR) repeat protein